LKSYLLSSNFNKIKITTLLEMIKMRTKLICFMGVDGSGKSTLSKYLCKELKTRGYKVSYIWWLECENSLIRKFLRKIGKSKVLGSKNESKKIMDKSIILTTKTTVFTEISNKLYPVIVLLDYLRFGIVKIWLSKAMNANKIIILDRFFYDVVLAISKEFALPYSIKAKFLNLYSKLLPSPDLIFVIDVSPEISYLRKKEEIKSIENAEKIRDDYQEVYSTIYSLQQGKIIKIDGNRTIESTERNILKTTVDFLKWHK